MLAGRYISLTTFKKDGTPKATAVWFVQKDGRVLIHTAAKSYKVLRAKRNPAVTVARCSMGGKVTGPVFNGHAEILGDDELAQANAILGRKYRFDKKVLGVLRWVNVHVLRHAPEGPSVVLAVTLD
jgi:hypothetical protein